MYEKLSRYTILSLLFACSSVPESLFSQQMQIQQSPQQQQVQQSPLQQQVQQSPQQQQAQLAPEQAQMFTNAQQAALAWLNLVDQGKYGESWDAASLTFQFTITRNEWIKAMTIARQPLGNVQSRQMLRQDPAQNPKDLPAGWYMVVYFQTVFSNRQTAHERIILQQQNSGQWKMLTYDVS